MPLLYPLNRLSQDGFRSRVGSRAHTIRPSITGPRHCADICAARIDSTCNGTILQAYWNHFVQVLYFDSKF